MREVQDQRRCLNEKKENEKRRLNALMWQKIAELGIAANQVPGIIDWSLIPDVSIYDSEDTMNVDPSLDEWEDVFKEDLDLGGHLVGQKVIQQARLQTIITAFGSRKIGSYTTNSQLLRRCAAEREWQAVAPQIIDPYLEWKHNQVTSRPELESDTTWSIPVLGHEAGNSLTTNVRQRKDENPNISLMQPSLGIQAFVKAICAFQHVKYVHTIEQLFSQAFDVFSDVQRRLQKRVDVVLGHDTSNWSMRYACPACSFEQPNEERLVPARMHAIDGCNSQKRDKMAGSCDEHTFNSEFFLSHDFVDGFKHEVKSHTAAQRAEKDPSNVIELEDGFVVPEGEHDDCCGSNWKAATSKELPPASKEAFEQTGIFACLCRHGIVEFLIKLVQSAEMAKHALAAVATILTEFGDDQGLGYDINCVLEVTLRNSSLQEDVVKKRLQCVVDAFHGWAHKRSCQVKYHPLYQPGFGLEDLSTCERFFSSLNGTARNIRHASSFHWMQSIDLHVQQVNADRYASLGSFLLHNYKQALSIQLNLGLELDAFKTSTKFCVADFRQWHQEEIAFLSITKRKEPKEITLKVSYVEALEKYYSFEERYNAARKSINEVDPFLNLTANDFAINVADEVVKRSEHEAISQELRLLNGRLERAEIHVGNLERLLGITEQWQQGDMEYKRILKYISNRKFVRIVEELQGLVVSRLMELEKVNLAGSGYKLRKHIAQALSRRCEAIRKAIDCYNTLAPLQNPPHPSLIYSEVVDYCNFSEFEILKCSDHDLLSKPWAVLANRQAAKKYFKIEHAKEEISRCNVEVVCLQAWIDEEDAHLHRVVAAHEVCSPAFAAHLKTVQLQHQHINEHLHVQLKQIYSLPGYSGPLPPVPSSSPPAPAHNISTTGEKVCVDDNESDDNNELPDDEDDDEMLRMTDALMKIMV